MSKPILDPTAVNWDKTQATPARVLVDVDAVPIGTVGNPLVVSGGGGGANASVGVTGVAVPGSATQVAGPDPGGLLTAAQVTTATPAGAAPGMVVRQTGTVEVSAPGGGALATNAILTGGTVLAQVTGTGTAGVPAAGVVSVQGVPGGTVVPVSAAALPLPTGAATEATLTGVLTTTAFQARINTQGQNTMAASTPVVIASDQSAVPVSGTVTITPSGVQTVTGNVQLDAAAPAANHLPVITAYATAADPAWTNGRETALSVNTSGQLRIVPALNIAPSAGAVPTSAALVAGTDGVNMQVPTVVKSLATKGVDYALTTNPINRTATASAPTAASVGVVSAAAVAANANRTGLVLTNNSNATISIAFGAPAVLNSGITLYPGGTFVMGTDIFSAAEIRAIASAAASTLGVQEFT